MNGASDRRYHKASLLYWRLELVPWSVIHNPKLLMKLVLGLLLSRSVTHSPVCGVAFCAMSTSVLHLSTGMHSAFNFFTAVRVEVLTTNLPHRTSSCCDLATPATLLD